MTEQPRPPHSSPDVKDEYEQRRKSRALWLAQEEALSRKIWILRRVVFAAGAVIILAAIYRIVPFWTPAIPVVAFLALMIWHQRVLARCLTAGRSVDFYERGIARIEDRWAGSGESGERFANKAHARTRRISISLAVVHSSSCSRRRGHTRARIVLHRGYSPRRTSTSSDSVRMQSVS